MDRWMIPIFPCGLAVWGREGLVSKRSDRPYRDGRSKDRIKLKNRWRQAFERVKAS